MGRPLSVKVHVKKSIVQVKAEKNCLAHALIRAIAKVTKTPITLHNSRGGKYTPQSISYLRRQVSAFTIVGESPNSNVFRTTFNNIRSLCITG